MVEAEKGGNIEDTNTLPPLDDFAIGEFRDMKMQPSLERALKHKQILGA